MSDLTDDLFGCGDEIDELGDVGDHVKVRDLTRERDKLQARLEKTTSLFWQLVQLPEQDRRQVAKQLAELGLEWSKEDVAAIRDGEG